MYLATGAGNGQKHWIRHNSSLTSLNRPLGEEPKPNSTTDKEKKPFPFPKRDFNVIKIKYREFLYLQKPTNVTLLPNPEYCIKVFVPLIPKDLLSSYGASQLCNCKSLEISRDQKL